jgi:hypothetical protein
MEIKGKIIVALPEVSGTSKAGNVWKKREYVLETQEQYPRKVFFNFFGDKVDQYPLSVGEIVTISFDIESREFNNRWYTDIRAWKAEKDAPGATATPATPAVDFPAAPEPFVADGGANDDLPF